MRYGTYIARTRQSDIARVEAGALKQTSSAAEAAAISEVDVQALCQWAQVISAYGWYDGCLKMVYRSNPSKCDFHREHHMIIGHNQGILSDTLFFRQTHLQQL